MNKEKLRHRAELNKNEDRKALKKFFAVLMIAMLIGLLAGVATVLVKESVWDIVFNEEKLQEIGKYVALIGSFLTTTLLLAGIVYYYSWSRSAFEGWEDEDEDTMLLIEKKISAGMFLVKLIMVESYFFFAFGCYTTKVFYIQGTSESLDMFSFLLVLVLFIYALTAGIISESKLVNLTKEINPEKKGSVYDMKFSEVWLESCDEAERYLAYKCAYGAYRVTERAIMVSWLICILWMVLTGTGMFAVVLVTTLWIVHLVSYHKRLKNN